MAALWMGNTILVIWINFVLTEKDKPLLINTDRRYFTVKIGNNQTNQTPSTFKNSVGDTRKNKNINQSDKIPTGIIERIPETDEMTPESNNKKKSTDTGEDFTSVLLPIHKNLTGLVSPMTNLTVGNKIIRRKIEKITDSKTEQKNKQNNNENNRDNERNTGDAENTGKNVSVTGTVKDTTYIILDQPWTSSVMQFSVAEPRILQNRTFQLSGERGLKLVLHGDFHLRNEITVGGGKSRKKNGAEGKVTLSTAKFLGGFSIAPGPCKKYSPQDGEKLKCYASGMGPGGTIQGAANGFNKKGRSIWGKAYGEGELFIGGSVGPKNVKGNTGAGGGVFILSVKGDLVVDGNIVANGYEDRDNFNCSGGSAGGLLYIRANKISLNKGRIQAKGGSSGRSQNLTYCTNGGAGGIVRLEALRFEVDASRLNVEGGRGIQNGRHGKAIVQTRFDGNVNINTTSCMLTSTDYPRAKYPGNITQQCCCFVFYKSVKFSSTTKIKITGKYPISLRIVEGDFDLHTNIDLMQHRNFDEDTFLGGSIHNAIKNPLENPADSTTGSFAAQELTGGKTFCQKDTEEDAFGGGAIEIIVEKGDVKLNGSILANAFAPENSTCTANGGAIRLEANSVRFLNESAVLSVVGSKNGGKGGSVRLMGNFDQHTLQKHIRNTTKTILYKASNPVTTTSTTTTATTATTNSAPTILPDLKILNKTQLTHDNFDGFLNALLYATEERMTNYTLDMQMAIHVLGKVAHFPIHYQSIEQAGSVLEKMVYSSENLLNQKLDSNRDGVEILSNNLAVTLERVSSKVGSQFNESHLSVHTNRIELEISGRNDSKSNQTFPLSCLHPQNDCPNKVEIDQAMFIDQPSLKVTTIVINIETRENLHFTRKWNKTSHSYRTNSSNETTPLKLVSSIFSVSFNNNKTQFKRPVLLTQKFQKQINTDGVPRVGYWREVHGSSGEWAFDGLSTVGVSDTTIYTLTQHFTSFAVLVQVVHFNISSTDRMALDILTYVGCGTSLFGCLLTFAVLFSVRTLSSERILIHMNLVVALTISQMIFLLGITATSNKAICTSVAVLLHYFFGAAFGWMLAEGIHLYMKVVSVYNGWMRMSFYHCIGWGSPMILVAISAAIRSEGYGSERHCWIDTSRNDGLIWAFVGPVLFVITVNLLIMALVLKILVESVKGPLKFDEIEARQQIKTGLKAMLILTPILGFTWVFGMVSVNNHTLFFQYVFAALTSSQGVFIFLLHCVGNTEVRHAVKRLHDKRVLEKSVRKDITNVSKAKTAVSRRSSSFGRKTSKQTMSSMVFYEAAATAPSKVLPT